MEEVSWVVGFPLEMLYNTGIGTEEADVGTEPGLRLAERRLQWEQGKKRWRGIKIINNHILRSREEMKS